MKKNKNIFNFISFVVVIAILFQSILPSVFLPKTYAITNKSNTSNGKFNDIDNHWANNDIGTLRENGIINGYLDGSFRPNDPITRAEFIIIINRATGIEAIDYNGKFTDVSENDWFAEGVSAAVKYEYILGYEDKTFRPRKYITRSEAAVVLARILKLELISELSFIDKDEIPDWARSYIGAVAKAGYINGYADKTFGGSKNITRAETSSLINKSLAVLAMYLAEPVAEDEKVTTNKKKVKKPVLSDISPKSGGFGTVMRITGKNFSEKSSENIVVFTGEKQGTMNAEVIKSSESELRVIVPGAVAETVKVSVTVNGYKTGTENYTIESLMDPTPEVSGNETKDTFNAMKSVVANTVHELNIALIPFMDQQSLGTEADDLEKGLTDLNDYLEDSLNDILSSKTAEELAQIDAVLSSGVMKEELAKLSIAADLLSHSTTVEALENINEAKKHIKDVEEVLQNLKTALRAVEATLGTASLLTLIFDFGLTAATSASIISTIEMIIDDIINPVLAILDTILVVLSMAPTTAVEGSLETYSYSDALGINQYFGSMENPKSNYDPGIVYIKQPYYLRGHIDFTNDGGKAEYLVNGFLSSTLAGILKYLDAIPDFNVNLQDVDVKLKMISDDSNIISGEWTDNGLKVTGVNIGETTIKVQADLAQIGHGIPAESLQIERKMKTLSGIETAPEFTQGPRIDNIENNDLTIPTNEELKAYIGDTLTFTGEGFSKTRSQQDVIFTAAPGYNDTGAAPKSHQSSKEYNSFDVEVSDALTGPLRVEVGAWPSNTKDITILEPQLTLSHPSAIIGEIWPVKGIGFSHTPSYNVGNWNGKTVAANVITLAHPTHHKRLEFVVPDGALSGPFKVTTIGVLDTGEVNTVVRDFSQEIALSKDSKTGLRPSVARDNDTGNLIATWIDQNEFKGNQIVSSVLPEGAATFEDVRVVSINVGGLQTAPPKPKVIAENGIYYIVWVGLKDNNDEVLFAYSDDGISWSTPMNISNSESSSLQPDIKVSDLDDDGDNDIVIVWTEEASSEDQNASVILSTLECNNNSYEIANTRIISDNGDAADPSIDVMDGMVAVSFSEDSGTMPDTYKRDVYLRTSTTNGLNFSLSGKINLSNNVGGMINKSMDFWDKSGLYRSARYPSIAIGHSPTDDTKNSVYIAYENTGMDYKEDVYFAKFDLTGGLRETVNMSQSKVHSQSPKLIVDADNTPTLTWIEQGFDSKNGWETNYTYGREESFDSKIVFARSFDGGETFNAPYMTLASNSDGNRMGHLSLAGSGSALLTMVWQDDDGDNPHIHMITTEGTIDKPVNYPNNELSLKNTEYLLRTYSSRSYFNDFDPDPQKWRKGDFYLSKLDGSDLRRITRDGSALGKASVSPDGRFIAYSHDWLYVAEADGSHPIGIWRGEMDIALDAYWSPSGKYIAFNAAGEMYSTINGMGIVKSSGKMDDNIFGPSDYGMQPWSIDDNLVYNPLGGGYNGEEGLGIVDTTFFDRFIFEEDEYDTFPSWSPDGTRIAFIRATSTREYGEGEYDEFGKLYIIDSNTGEIAKLTNENNVISPVWSPDGKKIAFVSNRDGNQEVYMIDVDGDMGSEINITNSPDYEDIMPAFSIDGKKLLVNAGSSEHSEMRIKMIDLDSLQTTYMTPINSSAGRVEILDLRAQGVTISTENTCVNEGEDRKFTILLDSKPIDTVNIQLDTVSSEMTIAPITLEFTSTNWNVPQSVSIFIADNALLDNDRSALISFDSQSGDEGYDGMLIPTKVIYIQDDEVLDVKPPTWPVTKSVTTSNVTSNSLTLTWTDAVDNWGVTKYYIYSKTENGSEILIGTVNGTENSFGVTGMDTGSSYTFRIEAIDAENNLSTGGPTINVDLNDLDAPTWPDGSSARTDNETDHGLFLHWTEADDNVGVSNYLIYQDGVLIDTILGTHKSYPVFNLGPDTDYTFKVEASDGANNTSNAGPTVVGRTTKDVDPPIWNEAELIASNIGANSLVLDWTDAIDNIDVTSYKIYKDGELIDTVNGDIKSYTSNGLSSYTSYSFIIQAGDGANNWTNNGPRITINTIGTEFSQGLGYETGDYNVNDMQPTVFNWTRHSRFVGADNPGMKWKYDIDNSNTSSNRASSPEIGADGTIYIGLEDNYYVINPDGLMKANTYHGGRSTSALGNNEKIYFGESDRLFEGYITGSSIYTNWGFNADNDMSSIFSTPAIGADGTIKFTIDRYMYSIDPDDMTNWANNTAMKWSVNIGGDHSQSYSSPAIGADGIIYVGSTYDSLIAVNPDGSYKWSYVTGDNIDSSPAIGSDGTIYIGSNDNKIYAINPDGTNKWEYETEDDVKSSPAIGSDGTIYIGSSDKNLYAINSDGTKKWNFSTEGEVISSPIIDANDVVYVGDGSGNLYAINTDGTKKWVFKAKAPISSSPAIGADGTIYFATDDSNLYALGTESCVYDFKVDNTDIDEDGGSVLITVNRSGDTSKEETIYYKNNPYDLRDTATNGWDFHNSEGYITFAAGESEKTYTIDIFDDTEIEGEEIIVLELADAVLGTIGSSTITITDDEYERKALLDFTKTSYLVNEDEGSVAISVTRQGKLDGPVRVQYDVVDGRYTTATEGEDFTEISGEVSFASGETEKTFIAKIINDALTEGNETIELSLSTVIAGQGELDGEIKSVDNTIITIVDDEVISAVTLTKDTETLGTIHVTGITPNTELRLYYDNGGVCRQVFPGDETTYTFENVTDGEGYYAIVMKNGIESARSNTVDIVYPRVGGFLGGATGSLSVGTENHTTKLTINNKGSYFYYLAFGFQAEEAPIEGTALGDLYTYQPMTDGIADNIYVVDGDYISIIQVAGPDYGDEVVGFTTIRVKQIDIKTVEED